MPRKRKIPKTLTVHLFKQSGKWHADAKVKTKPEWFSEDGLLLIFKYAHDFRLEPIQLIGMCEGTTTRGWLAPGGHIVVMRDVPQILLGLGSEPASYTR